MSQAPHPLTPSPQAACGVTSGPVPPTAPTCPRSATPRTGTCWWTGAMSTTCQVSEPTGLAGPLSMSERVCACLCLCVPLGRLPVAVRPRQHDALGLPAAALRPEGWAPPHGRRLHQQPPRQVAARSPTRMNTCRHTHGRVHSGHAHTQQQIRGHARGQACVELESAPMYYVQHGLTHIDTRAHTEGTRRPSGTPVWVHTSHARAHTFSLLTVRVAYSRMHVAHEIRPVSLHTSLSTYTLRAASDAHKCTHTDGGHLRVRGELSDEQGPAVPLRIPRARK